VGAVVCFLAILPSGSKPSRSVWAPGPSGRFCGRTSGLALAAATRSKAIPFRCAQCGGLKGNPRGSLCCKIWTRSGNRREWAQRLTRLCILTRLEPQSAGWLSRPITHDQTDRHRTAKSALSRRIACRKCHTRDDPFFQDRRMAEAGAMPLWFSALVEIVWWAVLALFARAGLPDRRELPRSVADSIAAQGFCTN